MKTILILFTLFLSTASLRADDLVIRPEPAQAIYNCHLLLAAQDIESKYKEWDFPATSDGGAHGGDGLFFKEGKHTVGVTVDKQWLGLRWTRDDKKVAEAWFLVGANDKPEAKVGILFDPASEKGDQVALRCDLYKQK
ncbi:MAG TPA: hypothetical protein VIH99_11845 [Bdellovibrionota bacterium]|jgi:hypothetical protein